MDLFLPHHVGDEASLAAFLTTTPARTALIDSPPSESDNDRLQPPFVLKLKVRPSRVLWRTLQPILFESPHARRALRCILHQCFAYDAITSQHVCDRKWSAPGPASAFQQTRMAMTTTNGKEYSEQDARRKVPSVQRRCVTLTFPSRRHHKQRKTKIFIWIQPPDIVLLEYLFASLLIRWEHRLIQAQSVSGYIATLGGGFFLCHHFQTAILLARQQQRMALFLNDESMYYTCFVHQAYSNIYAGKFRTAIKILRQVLQAIRPSTKAPSSYLVLVKMCLSARLFCKRMRQASQAGVSRNIYYDVAKGDTVSTTIDDHQRIKVARDKSKNDDLVIPFSRAFPRL